MRWSEIVGESSVDGVCHTPGTQFHITVRGNALGAVADLPKEVRLDLSDEDAQEIEDILHDSLESAIVSIVDRFNRNADRDWQLASENDPSND